MTNGSSDRRLPWFWGSMRLGLLWAGLILLQACTVLPRMLAPDALQRAVEAADSVTLEGVPFYPQQAYFCGPSSLSALFKHAGLSASPDVLAASIVTPDLKGTLRADLMASARLNGFVPVRVSGLHDLMRSLQGGLPVLVLVNLGLNFAPQWHYMVVYGYDRDEQAVLVRSGQMNVPSINVYTFEQLWQRADYWGMVVLRPDAALPGFVSSDEWLKESLNLDGVDQTAYKTALTTGSHSFEANGSFDFALGNLSLQEGDPQKATEWFEQSIQKEPEFAPAWNNLAEALYMKNRYLEAKKAVEKAILLGGKFAVEYEKTRKKIDSALTAAQ